MNDKKRYFEGKRKEIVRLILNNGCIPLQDLDLVTDNTATFRQQIYIMINEGVLYKERKNHLYYVTFKDFGVNGSLLTEGFNENDPLLKYYKYFGSDDSHFLISGSHQHKRRRMYNAEVGIFMEAAGLASQIGQKPNLYKSSLPRDCNAYFNSREVKGVDTYSISMDKDTQQLIGKTYNNGIIVTPGGTYAVINTGDSFLQFDAGETKFKNYVEHLAATKSLPKYNGCILLTRNYDAQYNYLTAETNNWQAKLNNLLFGYEKVYAVNIDREGINFIKLLSFSDWDNKLMSDFLAGKPRNPNSIVECDGQDDEAYYLLYCKPDLMKLKQFVTAAKSVDEKDKFRIICFDEQKDLLLRYTEDSCRIFTTPLKEYMEGVK